MPDVATKVKITDSILQECFQGVRDELPPVTPLYYVACKTIELLIRQKRFVHEEHLPSCLALAEVFGVSVTTTLAAYKLLVADEVVKLVRGRGYFVNWIDTTAQEGIETQETHLLRSSNVLSDGYAVDVPPDVINAFGDERANGLKCRISLGWGKREQPICYEILWYESDPQRRLLKHQCDDVALATKLKCSVGFRKASNEIAMHLNVKAECQLFCATQYVFEQRTEKLVTLTFSYINTEELKLVDNQDFFSIRSCSDWSIHF